MDVSSPALNAISGQMNGDAVGLSVLKKALTVQAQGAAALVKALPQPAANNLPSHLGQSVDTTA